MHKSKPRVVGAATAAGSASIHLLLAREYLAEQPYIGALFTSGGVGSTAVAIKLWRADHQLSWALGTLIAVGMAAGLLLSRTVGLPGFHESEWEPSAVLSLLLEGGFIGAAAIAVGRQLRSPFGSDGTRTRHRLDPA